MTPMRVSVPARHGETTEVRQVTVMLETTGPNQGRGKLWIAAVDLPWLCEYMHAELKGGGVEEPAAPVVPDDDPAAAGGGGYLLRWSPDGSWTAQITRGPLKDKGKFMVRLGDLTQARFEEGAKLIDCSTTWQQADHFAKRDALRAWLERTVREKMAAAEAQEQVESTPSSQTGGGGDTQGSGDASSTPDVASAGA